MKNKIISFISVLIIIVSFSSCSSDIKYYEDNSGVKYEIVPDKDGNIITKDNKLLVYVLSDTGKKIKNENGEYRTEYIAFNGQVIDNGYAETDGMKFKIPNGFKSTGNTTMLFYNDDYNADIFIVNKGKVDIETMKKNMEISCNELQESYGSDKFNYEISQFELPSINATVYKYKLICTSSDHKMNDYSYYFTYNDNVYSVEGSVNNKDDGKVDYDKFVKSIKFKTST